MTIEPAWGIPPKPWQKLMYSFTKWPPGPSSLHGGHIVANSLKKLFGCNMLTVVVSGGLLMCGPHLTIVGMITMNI
jgi:hypothetical protein